MITTAGVITEYATGVGQGSAPYGITLGPDGNIWFTVLSTGTVGRLTVDNSSAIDVNTASSGPGSVSGSVTVASGASTTLIANPDTNASFVHWVCSDETSSVNTVLTLTPTTDVTCTATFETDQEEQADLEFTLSTTSKNGPTYSQSTTFSVTGGSGTGAVTYSIDPSSTATGCSLDSSSAPTSVTATSIGTCVIKATKASDDDYLEATALATFTFNKGSQSGFELDLGMSSKVGSPYVQDTSVTVTGGNGSGAVTYSIDPSSTATDCALDSTTAPTNVTASSTGTCVVKATKAGDSDYLETSTTAVFTFRAAVMKKSFTIYFDALSSVLTPAAKKTILRVYRNLQNRISPDAEVTIRINGRVQPNGVQSNVESLSRSRAKAVAKHLRARGLEGEYILKALGETDKNDAKSRKATVTINWVN
jgi:outer membrane protein OmpA-like peptidoglycan-associated protein